MSIFRIPLCRAILGGLVLLDSTVQADVHGPICQWNKSPESAAVIHWITTGKQEVTAKVKFAFRKTGGSRWEQKDVDTRPFADTGNGVRSVGLSMLSPGTEYEFLIKEGDAKPLGPYTFRTAPGSLGQRFHFVAGGDMFHKKRWLDAMNRQAGQQDPVFALLGGDLAYANGRDAGRWYQWLDSWVENAVTPDGRIVPMVVAIGNHEIDGNTQPLPPAKAKYFYSLFQFPEDVSNYAIDFAGYLSIVLLDSGHSQPVSAQTAWLDSALSTRDRFPYLFACYHRPTYGTLVKPDNEDIRSQWVPLFEDHRVDLVFENDHHVYKRTHPIYKNEKTGDKGVVYTGDGAWGVGVRNIPKKKIKSLDYLAKTANKRHLIAITLEPRNLKCGAVTANGNVFDSFTRPAKRRH